MQRYLLFVDDLSTWVGKTFAWCILALTLATSYDVVMRYVFSAPTGWAYDTEYILYGTLFMMAGAYAVSQDAHVRGDFVARMLPVKVRAGIELACLILFFFPAMLALLYSGYGTFTSRGCRTSTARRAQQGRQSIRSRRSFLSPRSSCCCRGRSRSFGA